MLTKIILKNYTSFRNETTIDFSRTNYKVLEESNVSDTGVLKGAMFVGANASGKSNALLAVRFLLDELLQDTKTKHSLLHCLFSNQDETSISYFFLIGNKEINYVIKLGRKRQILSEKLFVDKDPLIERMGTTAISHITEKRNYDELDSEILFLRTVYFNTGFSKIGILAKWFEFLKNSVYFNAFTRTRTSYGKNILPIGEYLDKNGTQDINSFFTDYNFEQTIDYSESARGWNYQITGDEKRIFFNRKGVNAPIPAELESLGNRTLLEMLPSIIYVSQNNGMLLMDEFSSGFHNELERLIVKYFMETSMHSQIIFVSHSTNLLSTSILRPDQIYSFEFHGGEGSAVKRFSEEQPRVSQNLEKMYLSGVFGGLPDYKNNYEN